MKGKAKNEWMWRNEERVDKENSENEQRIVTQKYTEELSGRKKLTVTINMSISMQSYVGGEEGEMELVWTTYVRIRIEGDAKAGNRQRFKANRIKRGG